MLKVILSHDKIREKTEADTESPTSFTWVQQPSDYIIMMMVFIIIINIIIVIVVVKFLSFYTDVLVYS